MLSRDVLKILLKISHESVGMSMFARTHLQQFVFIAVVSEE